MHQDGMPASLPTWLFMIQGGKMRKHPLLAFATPVLGLAIAASLYSVEDATASTKNVPHSRAVTSGVHARRQYHFAARNKQLAQRRRQTQSVVLNRPMIFLLPSSVSSNLVPNGQSSDKLWTELRSCESNGNYGEDSGNGFYGAYQFTLHSWYLTGEHGMPNAAPPAVQDSAAKRLLAIQGWTAWPNCTWALGLA
jgi:hypothetical protein